MTKRCFFAIVLMLFITSLAVLRFGEGVFYITPTETATVNIDLSADTDIVCEVESVKENTNLMIPGGKIIDVLEKSENYETNNVVEQVYTDENKPTTEYPTEEYSGTSVVMESVSEDVTECVAEEYSGTPFVMESVSESDTKRDIENSVVVTAAAVDTSSITAAAAKSFTEYAAEEYPSEEYAVEEHPSEEYSGTPFVMESVLESDSEGYLE